VPAAWVHSWLEPLTLSGRTLPPLPLPFSHTCHSTPMIFWGYLLPRLGSAAVPATATAACRLPAGLLEYTRLPTPFCSVHFSAACLQGLFHLGLYCGFSSSACSGRAYTGNFTWEGLGLLLPGMGGYDAWPACCLPAITITTTSGNTACHQCLHYHSGLQGVLMPLMGMPATTTI